MMGSPYYYDVLFDDGDFVPHDCMWSGICTCCIQLLHQDLKVEDFPILKYEQPPLSEKFSHQNSKNSNDNNLDPTATTIDGTRTLPTLATTTTAISQNSQLNHHLDQFHQQQHHHIHHKHHDTTNGRFLDPNSASELNTVVVRSASSSNRNSPDNLNPSSLSSSNRNSPDNSNSSSLNLNSLASTIATSSSSSTASSSTSTSPKPLRRREHNDSERKRRDHLRNAFNFLRDQVPRFKQMNKKPPRIQILHEATKYVQCIMRESQDIEKRLEEERAKHARLKQQQQQLE